MPTISVAAIPAAVSGYSSARRQAAGSGQGPDGSDIGAFREVCGYSHMNFDDALVYPGQPGKSHSHVYFGNTVADANLTASNILSAPSSTCAGGLLNRSAYWAPALIDTASGAPMKPDDSLFYYKTGYDGVAPATIKQVPPGLRMIAGDSKSTTAQAGGVIRYGCNVGGVDGVWQSSIPTCPVGSYVTMEINFPQCWDGVNLDSPDHKSHVAYPILPGDDPKGVGGCPSTHPVGLPIITFHVRYTISKAYAANSLRLSSDNYAASQPAGYSGHGDYFMGWDTSAIKTFTDNCLVKSMDCHAYLLGDGTTLY